MVLFYYKLVMSNIKQDIAIINERLKKIYILYRKLKGSQGGSGGIENVKVNGSELPIVDNGVNITVPTKTSNLINDSGYTTNTELNKKLDKPTIDNTNEYVILGDGTTAPKNDFGKVNSVNGINPDNNKNISIGLDDVAKQGSTINRTVTVSQNGGKLDLFGTNNGGAIYKDSLGDSSYLISGGKVGGTQKVVNGDFPEPNIPMHGTLSYRGLEFTFKSTGNFNNRLKIEPERVSAGASYTLKLPAKNGIIATTDDIQDIYAKPTHWTNASQRFSGLVDKSSDATYNKVMVLDADGKAGVKNLNSDTLIDILTNATPEKITQIKTLLGV